MFIAGPTPLRVQLTCRLEEIPSKRSPSEISFSRRPGGLIMSSSLGPRGSSRVRLNACCRLGFFFQDLNGEPGTKERLPVQPMAAVRRGRERTFLFRRLIFKKPGTYLGSTLNVCPVGVFLSAKSVSPPNWECFRTRESCRG